MHGSCTVHAPFLHSLCASGRTLRTGGLSLPLFVAALLTLLGAPSHAQTYTPPEGCRLEMTVQERSCTVTQHYKCRTDAPGDQRVSVFDRDGETYRSRIDKETRWMESTSVASDINDRLIEEAKDHASLSTLLSTGRDDFDFWTESDTGEKLHHIGHDELTGETTTISGVELLVTRFDLKTYSESGDLLIHRVGGQYVSKVHGRFYGGEETDTDWTGAEEKANNSPARFIFPGQPGFGSTTPEYDCNAQMVSVGGDGHAG